MFFKPMNAMLTFQIVRYTWLSINHTITPYSLRVDHICFSAAEISETLLFVLFPFRKDMHVFKHITRQHLYKALLKS